MTISDEERDYYRLKVGEMLKSEDEYSFGDDVWYPVTQLEMILPTFVGSYRRPIKK